MSGGEVLAHERELAFLLWIAREERVRFSFTDHEMLAFKVIVCVDRLRDRDGNGRERDWDCGPGQ